MPPKKKKKSKENKCHIKPLLQIAAATSQQLPLVGIEFVKYKTALNTLIQ